MIFDPRDILIIGDSFAYCRADETHWPYRLTNLLTNQAIIPRGQGFPGSAWWSVRNRLYKDLKEHVPKVLILCHTDATRINSNQDLPLTSAISLKDAQYENSPITRQIAVASIKYYESLFCLEFHEWAQVKWFEEVNDIIKKYQIPYVIHMHVSDAVNQPGKELYTFTFGTTIEQSLRSMMSKAAWDSVPNHLTEEENIKLADNLYDIIKNYPGNCTKRLNW